MKKYFIFLLFIVFFGIPTFAYAAEHIISFDADIAIQTDLSVDITEAIVYDFDGNERHGIYRTIPISYTSSFFSITKGFQVLSVTDEQGRSYQFTTSKTNGDVTIKIGDADVLISGVKTYVIHYTMDDVVQLFDDYDMLSWNVTGNDWQVAIDHATATITMPQFVPGSTVNMQCYHGVRGSTASCEQTSLQTFSVSHLSQYQGMTVDVRFPKGIVHAPTSAEQWYSRIILGLQVGLLPLIFTFIFLAWWYRRGRDPKGRGTIITQFDAPEGLSPLDVGILMDEKIDKRDISATIISLAVQGYLKITRIPSKFRGTKDYEFTLLKDKNTVPDKIEREILTSIFSDDKTTVSLNADLKYKFAERLLKIKMHAYKRTKDVGYFTMNPQTVQSFGWIGGVICIFVAFLFISISFIVFINIALVGVIIFVFVPLLSALTKKGMEVKEYILGFKSYLTVAEKDRITFHHAPEKNPEIFEKFLSYAMVLRVEKKWATQFDGLFQFEPTWYHDPAMSVFVPSVFAQDLNSFSKSSSATLETSRSSGGGGSSGGGFGGGGGGSW